MSAVEHRKVYIAGHTGLVGSALVARLSALDGVRLLVAGRSELDLTDSQAVDRFLSKEKPDIVIVAAGKVGGIRANSVYPADFIYQNLMIEANLVHAAWKAGVRRLLNFGSSCMYPKHCPQPMSPDLLMTGKVEPTSESYAVAKLVALSLCAAYNRQYGTSYVTAIPCNLYGPGDAFDPESGHVISALIRRFHEARERGDREVVVWGTGEARREFLHVDNVADACEVLLRDYHGSAPVNIGSSECHTVRDIATLIAQVVGFHGDIRWDTSQPDGMSERLLDSSVMRSLGWSPRVDLRSGLERTYHWFLQHYDKIAGKYPRTHDVLTRAQ